VDDIIRVNFKSVFVYVLFSNNFDISTRNFVSVSALKQWHNAMWLRGTRWLCGLGCISAAISFLDTGVSLLVNFLKAAASATCWSLVGKCPVERLCVGLCVILELKPLVSLASVYLQHHNKKVKWSLLTDTRIGGHVFFQLFYNEVLSVLLALL